MKINYRIDYNFNADVVIEIDDEVMTEKVLTEINQFWPGDKERLRDENGSLLHAVLKLLTQVILRNVVEYSYNATGITDLFDDNERNGGIEGWPKMDGSWGIKIISVDQFDFEPNDMSITVS